MSPSSRRRRLRSSLLAVVLAALLVSCGGEDGAGEEELTPAPNVPVETTETPADGATPTPQATGTAAGDVQIDLSALATGDVDTAALGGPLTVQACLGGQCQEYEVDPATIGQETLSLDASGLQAGAQTPVTVTVAAPDGTLLAEQQDTFTLGEGETSVTVEPSQDG